MLRHFVGFVGFGGFGGAHLALVNWFKVNTCGVNLASLFTFYWKKKKEIRR